VRPDVASARSALDGASTIIVLGHIRPDGDAVGAVLGLTLSLRLAGKAAIPVLVDGIPSRFRFLPGASDVQKTLEGEYDLLVTVDCSDLERTGFPEELQSKKPDINIDHHPTNTQFAVTNLIDPQAAATTEIIYSLTEPLGLSIDDHVATNYLAGLVTDTLGFRTPNVTSTTLQIAAGLVDYGAPLADIYHRTLSQKSFAAARFWGEGLKKLSRDGKLIWTSLSLEEREQSSYPGKDDALSSGTAESALSSQGFFAFPFVFLSCAWIRSIIP